MNLLNSLLNDQTITSITSSVTNPNSTSTSIQNDANNHKPSSNATSPTTSFSQSSPTNSSTQPSSLNAASSSSSQFMADKLMERIISMIIPVQNDDEFTTKMLNERIEWQKTRPSLSFAIMQKNSNMLHQRNSSTYELFNNVLKFVNWTDPYYTIGILLIITHVILRPYLITIIPMVSLVITVLIPHYLIIYPVNSATAKPRNRVSPVPLNLSKLPKPVPLFSKEFFINLTDTQNFMCLQIYLFDFWVWFTSDYLYFKNEQISSIILLGCLGLIIVNLYLTPFVIKFLYANFWIVQLNSIFIFWLVTTLFHPIPREVILEWIYNEDTRMNFQNFANKIEDKLTNILVKSNDLEKFQENPESFAYDNSNTDNDSQYVEIYELQKLNHKTKIWELVGFSNDFYTTNTVIRKYNLTNLGSPLKLYVKESISEVQPPMDYKFMKNTNWVVDFEINEWVERNSIKDLVLIDDDEKWAYDFNMENNNEFVNDDDNDNNFANSKVEIYRRRRWIRKVIRENYKDKDIQIPHSHLAEWLG